MLSDSGKLMVLDQLLTQMKKEGHRVLIYSQMTKMIDILEVSTEGEERNIDIFLSFPGFYKVSCDYIIRLASL